MPTSSTVVISGAASGLGAAAMRKLAQTGRNIVAVDLNSVSPSQLPANAISLECDVTDADQVSEVMRTAVHKFGSVDGLVCCAGIAPGHKLVGRDGPHSLEIFKKTLDINITGTFNLLRLAASEMSDNTPDENGQRGVIVMTASVAAFEGQIGQIAYAASKGAVAAMTLPAARELARAGVRVVSIAPGVFDTPMMQAMPQNVRDAIGATVPFPPKLGDPDDFGALVEHIFANQTLNGEVIRLDGALRMSAK